MRKLTLCVVAALAICAVVYFGHIAGLFNHRLTLKAYLLDAHGLRAGAPVSLAGVYIGKVKTVRVLSQPGKSTAEVTFFISTPYELNIPNDAAVTTASEGVFADTYIEINMERATGPPATNGAVLKAIAPEPDKTTELLHSLVEAVREDKQHNQTTVGKPAASIPQASPKQ